MAGIGPLNIPFPSGHFLIQIHPLIGHIQNVENVPEVGTDNRHTDRELGAVRGCDPRAEIGKGIGVEREQKISTNIDDHGVAIGAKIDTQGGKNAAHGLKVDQKVGQGKNGDRGVKNGGLEVGQGAGGRTDDQGVKSEGIRIVDGADLQVDTGQVVKRPK